MSRFKRSALEKDLEQRCRRWIEKRGGKLIKMTSLGNPGFPDRLLMLPMHHVLVEFKRPGKKPTKVQDHWHGVLRAAGFKVWIVDDYAMFVDTVDAMVTL